MYTFCILTVEILLTWHFEVNSSVYPSKTCPALWMCICIIMTFIGAQGWTLTWHVLLSIEGCPSTNTFYHFLTSCKYQNIWYQLEHTTTRVMNLFPSRQPIQNTYSTSCNVLWVKLPSSGIYCILLYWLRLGLHIGLVSCSKRCIWCLICFMTWMSSRTVNHWRVNDFNDIKKQRWDKYKDSFKAGEKQACAVNDILAMTVRLITGSVCMWQTEGMKGA